jgi:polyisoprenoid-binding protein YceI
MSWLIDPAHTLIEFSAKHMMITTVRGRFTKFGGTLTVDEQNPANSTAEGYVELASVDTHEPNRDAHLRSADFFDVEKYPTMTFRSTRVQKVSDDQYKVAGDLMIKGVTREVVFDVTDDGRNKDPWGNLRWGLTAQTTLNRKDFGLTWNVALEAGGWLVGDQVKVHTELQLIYKPE